MTALRFSWLLLACIVSLLGGAPRSFAQTIEAGVWSGEVTLPSRTALELSIEIGEREDGEQWARLTIPAQGVVDQELDLVSVDGREITFSWNQVGARFSGRLGVNGESIVGTLEQAGQTFPFRLRRDAPVQKFDDEIVREEQRWKGVAKLPGIDVEFLVTFTPSPAETGWTAMIDIPVQNVERMPLKRVRFDDEIHFTIQLAEEGAPPPATFKLRRTGADAAKGVFTQAGSQFRVTMSRLTDPNETIELDRPQTPEPPFPYAQREVTYTSPVDGVTLAGTLTIPEGKGPHPAVLMLTGSGPQDRDETIMGHKPFLVIADHLTRRGVAVLRVDDRGVGGSGGDVMRTDARTNIADAITGVTFLAKQPEIDPSRIGLIGHSEGAWIAPMAAAESDDVAFVVMLAAPGVSGAELLLMQRDAIRRVVGVPAEQRRLEREKHEALIEAIASGAADAEIEAALRELARAEFQGASDIDALMDRVVAQQMPMMTSPWFRDVLKLDSRPALRALRIPVLVVTGELDLQVPPDQNMPPIRGALNAAGNTKAKLVTMPGLNHLLQRANRGLPSEYIAIPETISPDALTLMTEWIQDRAGVERGADAD